MVRSIIPVPQESLIFPTLVSSDEDFESKKWLKHILKSNNWPESLLSDDSKSLKRIGIRKTNSLRILSKDDWHNADINLGIKLCIENYILNEKLCYEFSDLQVETYPTQPNLPRVRVQNEQGQIYEVDRFCPHKGADLSKVHLNNLTCTRPR